MDIRSFFGKKPSNRKTSINIAASKPSKKKRLVISDSDDDDIVEIPVKKQKTDAPVISKVHSSETKKKAAAPIDFFGSSKVKKEHKPVVIKKPEKKVQRVSSGEIDDFSDDDEELFNDASFVETLNELDKSSPKQKENVTPPKESGLSEKLFVKKNVMSWKDRIGETNKSGSGVVSTKSGSGVVSTKTPSNDRKRPRSDDDGPSSSKGPAKTSTTPSRKSSSEKSADDNLAATPSQPKKGKSADDSLAATPSQPKKEKSADDSLAATPSQPKKGNSGYWSYKSREGPKNLGSKEIPEGAGNCLEGLTFVISGVLDSIERDDAADLIKKYGGRVTSAVSKKTSYLVKGEGCGAKKLETAERFNTKQIEEDGLLELIRTKPGKKSAYDIKVEKEQKALVKENKKLQAQQNLVSETITVDTNHVKKEDSSINHVKKEDSSIKNVKKEDSSIKNEAPVKKEAVSVKKEPVSVKKEPVSVTKQKITSSAGSECWTEKYRPNRVKDIIGQQGERSNVNKLLKWLKNWERCNNNKPGVKSPFNKDEGSHLKAALLSGPPGIGKTTSATVCSRELGFSYLELNASDARSKKSIREQVADVLNNHTINGLTQKGAQGDKHILIMDEVDGMAGNEDRGGVAELIGLIKTTRIPIICICNDRNHQKIRSLSNYCFDLRFYKPRVEQVKGAMMSIAFKEGLRIPPPAMQKIVEGANSDIRQVLNHIHMWSAGNKSMTFEQASADADRAKKDANIGIFDIPRLFFSGGEETRRYTYTDYSDLFFQDYRMTPFFIHENYVRSRPTRARGSNYNTLIALSNAADSICFGDHVGTEIKMQNWSLLPTQSHFSAIMPAWYMRGGLAGMTQFPQILGQTSKKNRCDGLLQDLLNHMILQVSTDKRQLGMEYLPILKHKLVSPMLKRESDGVSEVLEVMNTYNLQREDWDSVMELSTFSPHPSPAANLNTKTKSTFTRLYNKQSHMNPYASETAATKKKKAKAVASTDDAPVSGGEDGEADDGDDDAMIKPKKPAAASRKPAAASKKPAPKKSASGKNPAPKKTAAKKK